MKQHTNPYPGIRPFDSGDSTFFFGRDAQVLELEQKLQQTNFLAVVGYSGSGKSSLVRAGFIPKLKKNGTWRVALFRPQNEPIDNLADALNEPEALGNFIDTAYTKINLDYSSKGITETLSRSTFQGKLLIVVDQFEELFRFMGNNRDEAIRFANLITSAVQEPGARVSVIILMRSEFLGDCAEFRGLPELINEGQFLIPRLTRQQYREAIIRPLEAQGIGMTQSLLSKLLNDIGTDPDQLPVLQHALMLTFSEWMKDESADVIDLKHYDATGGMVDGINKHCNELLSTLIDKKLNAVVIGVFQQLTDITAEGVIIRRATPLKELFSTNMGHESEVVEVVDLFRAEGNNFLMPSKETISLSPETGVDTVIDISHECIMRKWKSLKEWILKEEDDKRLLTRIIERYGEYHRRRRGLASRPTLAIYLYPGGNTNHFIQHT